MLPTNVTTPPDEDEDRPGRPFQWWSGAAIFSLGMTGFIGALLGALLGSALGTTTGLPLFWLVGLLVGLGLGVVVGMALGYRDVRARIGYGQRTSGEPLPSLPPLRPGVGAGTHIQRVHDQRKNATPRRYTSTPG